MVERAKTLALVSGRATLSKASQNFAHHPHNFCRAGLHIDAPLAEITGHLARCWFGELRVQIAFPDLKLK
jgi:hypothetical protein